MGAILQWHCYPSERKVKNTGNTERAWYGNPARHVSFWASYSGVRDRRSHGVGFGDGRTRDSSSTKSAVVATIEKETQQRRRTMRSMRLPTHSVVEPATFRIQHQNRHTHTPSRHEQLQYSAGAARGFAAATLQCARVASCVALIAVAGPSVVTLTVFSSRIRG